MNAKMVQKPLFGVYFPGNRKLTLPPATTPTDADRVYLAVPRLHQQRSLSCEMASLRMAAQYQKVTRSEAELVQLMATDVTQPKLENGKLIWADPNRVFPGNVRGWQLYHGGVRQQPYRARRAGWGYGIYAPGIAEVAAKIGLQAEVFDQVDRVYTALERGHVPIVIVPCSGRSTSRKWSWVTPQGTVVPAINSEHAIVVTGYNEQRVWVNDPMGKVAVYERIVFERAFALLASGVVIGPANPLVPAPELPEGVVQRPWYWPFHR